MMHFEAKYDRSQRYDELDVSGQPRTGFLGADIAIPR